ncbi:MAG: hypothetical protein JWQ66_4047 [Mucilaginibacter sp.]|nr:hypothetical protein [Mucilaginibacter sp.]
MRLALIYCLVLFCSHGWAMLNTSIVSLFSLSRFNKLLVYHLAAINFS